MERQAERELELLIALFGRAEAEVGRQLAEAVSKENLGTAINRRAKREQLQGVLARLLQSTLGDPGRLDRELDSDSPAWRVIRLAYRDGADAANRNLERNGVPGLTRSFTQTHQDAAEVLYENLRDRLIDAVGFVGRRADDVFRRVALDEVTQGILQGRTRERNSTAIADRLRERGVKAFRNSRGHEMDLGKYAEMVARTTTREAVTMGTLNRIAESGVDLIRVSKHQGSCERCRKFEDRIFSIREGHPKYPTMRDVPPFHPNCLTPGQLVSAANIEASSERWYEGEVVVIRTAGGNEITCTPNHPVLTSRGWTPAGMIEEGGDVIASTDLKRVMQSVDPDYDDVPALIEDVAHSVGVSGDVPPRSVEVSPEDFHGDGLGSEVAVVRTDSLLGSGLDAAPFEHGCELDLCPACAELLALAGRGPLDFLVEGRNAASGRDVGGSDSRPALFGAKTSVESPSGFGAREGSTLAVDPSADGGGFDAQLARDLRLSLSGMVEADRVIHKSLRVFRGHVYNLQTGSGWYVCNSIITHNCGHVIYPFLDVEDLVA